MKTFDNTNYYTKAEAAERIGCSIITLNARICKTQTQGYNFGRQKYYTEAQIKTLAEYRKK